MKPKQKVLIKWSSNFSYALGLLASDGNLAKNSGHINFTSKDKDQILNFSSCLGIHNKIGTKLSGSGNRSFYIQFGDVVFHRFLISIGITPRKSKTIGKVKIPKKYFFDFLRGVFDGDGTFYSYYDPRWRSSFMFYTGFTSASIKHVKWLRDSIFKKLGI